MQGTFNFEKNKREIQSIIGEKVAIESNPNNAFEAFAFVAKTYFESCGCKVIRFHRELPSFTQILISKVLFLLNIRKKKLTDGGVIPGLLIVGIWNIQSIIYSYYNFLMLCLHVKNIFKLTIDDIDIGEELASDVTRFSQKLDTKNIISFRLIKSMKNFYLTCKYAKFISNKCGVDAFMVSHYTYSWAMFSKVAILLNKKYLLLGRYPYSIFVTPEHRNPHHPQALSTLQKTKCNNKERRVAENYMQERISPDKIMLHYMEVSAYSVSGENFFRKYNSEKGIINCCLFLHSFTDALFTFGYDSFNNIWHWTDFTIRELSKEKNVRIFIKPHPSLTHKMRTSFDTSKKDYLAFSLLKDKYESHPAVEFIPPSTSNIDIASMENFIGITHHGNVAPELAFLNKPVIASIHAPWKFFSDFLISWENKFEYKQQLNNLEKYIDFTPNKSNLLDFVYMYYIEPNLISDSRFFGHKLYELIYGKDAKYLSESIQKGIEMLTIIRKDKNKLQEGLSMFDGMINQAIINCRNASKL